MQLTIRVSQEVAPALASGEATDPRARELLRLAATSGIRLQPLHPGTVDPRLASWFVAEIPEASAVQGVLAQLRQCEAVEAAYIKPPDDLP
jgi:hypothetical protein